MKQRINIRLISITIVAVFATLICVTYVYYGLFQEQVRNDLKVEARILSEAGIAGLVGNDAVIGDEDIRITWISKEGKVLFDNDVDVNNLGNHLDRPEVSSAFKEGHGESVRESDTLNMKTFYYALLLKDGTVLRLAKEVRSLGSVFGSAFPITIVIALAITVLCIVVGHYLTKQLLRPISEMAENMDRPMGKSNYKELEPFVKRIREQHEDVLAAAQSRQDFTANVSHELKTPITAISGYAELIENQMVDEAQQRKFAGDIRKNSERLVSLINDIIRLSELDRKNLAMEFGPVDLFEIAEERMELLKHSASMRGVTLSLEGRVCEVLSSRTLIVELLDNLVENAIRYNKENGAVKVYIYPSLSRGVMVVEDTGIGIPEAEQKRIFERFYRVDKSRSRETGGTGLGLAIVKHVVELHNGNIELESELGKGTKITVTL